MKKFRLIARIDVKNEFVIKGIHLEGLRKVGDPNKLAKKYYEAQVDEIFFMDVVASLYERNNLYHIIEQACTEIFIPITIGGGIRSVDDIQSALRSGADKVALNTQAIKTPELIEESSRKFGRQCIVGSIEAKRKRSGWEAYIDNGRESTGVDVIEWASRLEALGAGELILTSVDQEGTKKGYDIELAKVVCSQVNIPVIASGGIGQPTHLSQLCEQAPVDGVAIASVLHYNLNTPEEFKKELSRNNVEVRL